MADDDPRGNNSGWDSWSDPQWNGDQTWGPAADPATVSYGEGRGAEPGPRWPRSAVAALAVVSVVALALVAGLVVVLLRGGSDDGDGGATAAAPSSSAGSPTSAAPAAAPTSGASSAVSSSPAAPSTQAAAASSTPAASSGCNPDTIAADMGRPRRQVNLVECAGDWAYLSVVPLGTPAPGDVTYLARRTGGTWSEYDNFPSRRCQAEAQADGVPAKWVPSFMPCASTSSRPPVSTTGDLGLSTPITTPTCDGRGIVVLLSAVTPGNYAAEVSAGLAANPGAMYLRTDTACPSLRQRDDNGNLIYAVFRYSGYSQAQVCSDVSRYGGYGRWLSMTKSPSELVTC